MPNETCSFDVNRFNNLPDIEFASAEMKEKGKLPIAFSVLGLIFQKHDMCESWGISLLHNHWTLEPHELPIQDVKRLQSPVEYETTPRPASFGKKFSPSILAVNLATRCTLEPLEFSTEIRVEQSNNQLEQNSEFVSEFCRVVIQNDLADTFGLIVPKEVSSDELEFVEFNDGRISLLRETPIAESSSGLIETSWRFNPNEVASTCSSKCWARCTVSGSSHSKDHPKVHQP